jgi:hypothetical protein
LPAANNTQGESFYAYGDEPAWNLLDDFFGSEFRVALDDALGTDCCRNCPQWCNKTYGQVIDSLNNVCNTFCLETQQMGGMAIGYSCIDGCTYECSCQPDWGGYG